MTTDSIDRKSSRVREILRSAGLTTFRQILDPACFKRIWPFPLNPRAVLIPEVVFWLMAAVCLGESSMCGGVVAFWSTLRARMNWLPEMPVTEEAFCTARAKLSPRFFMRLFHDVAGRFNRQFGGRWRRKGRRLLGIDGMEVTLPNDPGLRELYPGSTNQHDAKTAPQARLVGLVGLWSSVCYAFRWTGLDVSEQVSARRLSHHLVCGDLLLTDRNFCDKETAAGIMHRKADFLIHVPSNRFTKLPRVPTPSGRPDEWFVEIPLGKRLRERYPELGRTLRLRMIEYQRPGFNKSWLVTSLSDVQAFTRDELVELYHERWRQETAHREWKQTLQLSNLRSHSASGLLKEVLVQLTMNNVVRWIMAEAVHESQRPVDLQFLDSKRLIMAWVPVMTLAPVERLPMLYRQLLAAIRRRQIRVRPGRSYPRKFDDRPRPKGHGRAAPPARLVGPVPDGVLRV